MLNTEHTTKKLNPRSPATNRVPQCGSEALLGAGEASLSGKHSSTYAPQLKPISAFVCCKYWASMQDLQDCTALEEKKV